LMQFSGNEHTIAYNELYEGCLHSDDMGAIYTGRDLTNRGNRILYNYIHDIGGKNAGTQGVQGVFLDDFWSAALIKGNVFENVQGGALKFVGSYNEAINNLFINCTETAGLINRSTLYGGSDETAVHQLTEPLKSKPYIYNDIWVEKYPSIVNVVDENGKPDLGNGIVLKDNVLYNTPNFKVTPEVAEKATIENNVEYKTDPGFYDAENRNYLLKTDSGVYEKIPGFEPIPFTRMGTYSERAIARVKKAYVLCSDSPYMMRKGDVYKNNVVAMKNIDGKLYIPVRTAIEAVEGELSFDETTKVITLSTEKNIVSFRDGATAEVNLNGNPHTLENSIKNIAFSNYISVSDLAKLFGKQIIEKDGIAVVSDYENLFVDNFDDGLLRYIKEQIMVY